MSGVFAIGDMHGCYDSYLGLLVGAGLCDSSGRWIGGKSVLVQTGDLIDRGPRSLAALRLTRRLQSESSERGGRVFFLLGGHEIFAMAAAYGNDWAALNWLTAQNGGHSTMLEWLSAGSFAMPQDEEQLCMLFEAFLSLFRAGEIASWLLNTPCATMVADSLFVHAGISREIPAQVEALNEASARSISALHNYLTGTDPLLGPKGPYWVRDLARDEVDRSLTANGAARLVIGHNPGTTVSTGHDGSVIGIDTNVARGGIPLSLHIQGDRLHVLDMSGNDYPIYGALPRRHGQTRRYVSVSSAGRFDRGDTVLIYSAPSGGQAVLKIHDIWSTGEDVIYSGPLVSYVPRKRNGPVRYNPSESWAFAGALVDAVGVPIKQLRRMPREFAEAVQMLVT